jgi:hypothetical protein
MAQAFDGPAPLPVPVPVPVRRASDVVVPDCERLDVYRVAVELQRLAAAVCSGR